MGRSRKTSFFFVDFGLVWRDNIDKELISMAFKYPKKLGEKIEIIDEQHERFGQQGFKQACRVDEGVEQVLVFFPISKSRGDLVQMNWSQCKRV